MDGIVGNFVSALFSLLTGFLTNVFGWLGDLFQGLQIS